MSIPPGCPPNPAAEAELEAIFRLEAARTVIDAALLGDPDWLAAEVVATLADVVDSAATWLDRARRCAA